MFNLRNAKFVVVTDMFDEISEFVGVLTPQLKSQGIGSVSCDIHSDLDLNLEHACSTDEFDEADNLAFRLVCR